MKPEDVLLRWCRNSQRLPKNLGQIGMRVLNSGKHAIIDLESSKGFAVVGNNWQEIVVHLDEFYPDWRN